MMIAGLRRGFARSLTTATRPLLASTAMKAPVRAFCAGAEAPTPIVEHPEFERGLVLFEKECVGEAIDSFSTAAAAGSPGGNFFLALGYDGLLGENAEGEPWIDINAEAAFRCYERAAEAGHAEAAMNLALCYKNGDGVGRNIRKAFETMELSAALGSDRAQFNLGVSLDPLQPPWGSPGEVAPEEAMILKDPTRAMAFYQQASAQGHGKAKVNLGIFLYTATVPGTEPDRAAAEELWKEAMEDGVPEVRCPERAPCSCTALT